MNVVFHFAIADHAPFATGEGERLQLMADHVSGVQPNADGSITVTFSRYPGSINKNTHTGTIYVRAYHWTSQREQSLWSKPEKHSTGHKAVAVAS